MKQLHIPVMLDQVVQALSPKDGEVYVDATFGGGGYTKALLEAANCSVIAIDRDPMALERAQPFLEKYPQRFKFLPGTFSALGTLIPQTGISRINGIVFDIGVSSYQLDDATRGFSFRFEGPLDMRMSSEGESARDVVNTYKEEDLATIIYAYGEEKKSRQIARAIVERRRLQRFELTSDLADLVKSIVKFSGDIHPATRTFQALRIYVNDELNELKKGLEASVTILERLGRLVVVSFHSLEDRLVKTFLKEHHDSLNIMTKKPLLPLESEERINPRSRSARLRYAVMKGEL